MKQMHLAVALACISALSGLGALEVTGNAPEFEYIGSIPAGGLALNELNRELQEAFNDAVSGINRQIKDIGAEPVEAIKAFGSASVFASEGATLRGFAGYRRFSIAVGPMIGVQLPYSVFDVGELDAFAGKVMDKLEAEHDLAAGINVQGINLQFGLNTSFLVKNLYLGLKAGYFPGNSFMSDTITFSTFSIGALASYQFLAKQDIAKGLIVWRGLTFGSGVIYQNTAMGLQMPLESQKQSTDSFGLIINPRMALDINVNTVTIPLEAATSIRLLYFLNFSLGLGLDIGFGSSDIKAGAEADIDVTPKDIYAGVLRQSKPGSLALSAGGTEGPSILNPKLMVGVGISMGPVWIDVPFTFYLNNGYSAGITIGLSL